MSLDLVQAQLSEDGIMQTVRHPLGRSPVVRWPKAASKGGRIGLRNGGSQGTTLSATSPRSARNEAPGEVLRTRRGDYLAPTRRPLGVRCFPANTPSDSPRAEVKRMDPPAIGVHDGGRCDYFGEAVLITQGFDRRGNGDSPIRSVKGCRTGSNI